MSMQTSAAGLIGPNAVIQLGETLLAHDEARLAQRIYLAAGHPEWLFMPPSTMTPQADVIALHAALQQFAPPAQAQRYAAEAGQRTGEYLLANRIPGFARTILRLLPRRLAARLLLKAVAGHAWTFAGTGRFVVDVRAGSFSIQSNPLAREGGCVWHEAVFTRLFQALVDPRIQVRETECCAAGAGACRFEIIWP